MIILAFYTAQLLSGVWPRGIILRRCAFIKFKKIILVVYSIAAFVFFTTLTQASFAVQAPPDGDAQAESYASQSAEGGMDDGDPDGDGQGGDALGNAVLDSGDFNALLSGYAGVSSAGGRDGLASNYSFLYRYQEKIEERKAYEEKKRREEQEAKLAAEEERRLDDMRQRLASLTDEELGELYSNEYFTERLRELGYYKQDLANEQTNYRNAVIRLQASINMPIDAKLGAISKKALLEDSPVIPRDEVASPASEGYWITINKSKNILTVYKGSAVYHKYPVATGASSGLTPEGKFTIVTKSVNPSWGGGGYASPVAGGAPGNPLGKRWLGLSIGGGGRYGVHGNASPTSIGTYASHGCVRMINTDVESMYEYIPVGTPVWIGSDSKLSEYGIKQYYTITEVTEAVITPIADGESAPADNPVIGETPAMPGSEPPSDPESDSAVDIYAAPIAFDDDGN